jgi:hypothetical protein
MASLLNENCTETDLVIQPRLQTKTRFPIDTHYINREQ